MEKLQERIKNILIELESAVDNHISELRAARIEIASLRSKNVKLIRDIEILSIEITSLKHELETIQNNAKLCHELDSQKTEQNGPRDNARNQKVQTSITSPSSLTTTSSENTGLISDNLLSDSTTNEIEISITQLKDLLERRKKVNSVK